MSERTKESGKDRRGPGELVTFESFTPNLLHVEGREATTTLESQFDQWAEQHPNAEIVSERASLHVFTGGTTRLLVVRYYEPLPPPVTPTDPELEALLADKEKLSIKKMTRGIEELLVRRALEKTKGNRTRAGELLEISHRALLYKIQEFGIIYTTR